jgi:hypothetical protein
VCSPLAYPISSWRRPTFVFEVAAFFIKIASNRGQKILLPVTQSHYTVIAPGYGRRSMGPDLHLQYCSAPPARKTSRADDLSLAHEAPVAYTQLFPNQIRVSCWVHRARWIQSQNLWVTQRYFCVSDVEVLYRETLTVISCGGEARRNGYS